MIAKDMGIWSKTNWNQFDPFLPLGKKGFSLPKIIK